MAIPAIEIGGRRIGDGHPCFIIAEAGSNHNGSLERALELVAVAARGGADAVKFQLFRASKLYLRGAGPSAYLNTERSIYEIIREMELPRAWLPELAAACRRQGVEFLASVFDEESADALEPFVAAHKIASYEMTHLPLVRHVARTGKPLIISTGTAELAEVEETVGAAGGDRAPLALMQCTAAYPAPLGSLNIRAIAALKSAFGVPVGLSDHSRDPLVGPLAAVGAGANLLEKHLTLSNRLPGPDHGFAVEPEEFALMVRKVREAEQALGDGRKRPRPEEAELRAFARRSVFSTKPIAAGERLTAENVGVLRCGRLKGELAPKQIDDLLGKRAARDLPAETALRLGDWE